MNYITYDGELQKAGKPVDNIAEVYAMSADHHINYTFVGYKPHQTNPLTVTANGRSEWPLIGPIYIPAVEFAHIALLTSPDDRIIGSSIPNELSYELFDAENDFKIKPGKLPKSQPETHRDLLVLRQSGWDILCAGWRSNNAFLFQSVTSFAPGELYAYGVHQTILEAHGRGVRPVNVDTTMYINAFSSYVLLNAEEESNLDDLCNDLDRDWRQELFSNKHEDNAALLSALINVSNARISYMVRFREPGFRQSKIYGKAMSLIRRGDYNEFGIKDDKDL